VAVFNTAKIRFRSQWLENGRAIFSIWFDGQIHHRSQSVGMLGGLRMAGPLGPGGLRMAAGIRVGRQAASSASQPRRGFLSFLGFGSQAKKDASAAEVAEKALIAKMLENVRHPPPLPPMVESPIPALRELGEQYARASKGCKKCTAERMDYSCPTSGFPSHCTKECYDKDLTHQDHVRILRQVYEDNIDLRSGAQRESSLLTTYWSESTLSS